MRTLPLLLALVACDREITADQCLPTLGDHCSCEPKCMTQREIDKITDQCDLGCDTAAEAQDWGCTVVDNACAVAP